jgi:hypothetical protein
MADLGLVVVIPCFDEPDIRKPLRSLAACHPPLCQVEVLVVINAPAGASAEVREKNDAAVRNVIDWALGEAPNWLQVHAIRHDELPVRTAGVGLARKIGMDEAVARLARSRVMPGVVASLDADCTVADTYLRDIFFAFDNDPTCRALSIAFEHDISGAAHDPLRYAMVEYELHLRCYVQGQITARFPYAFHTIGSAMAFRAESYAAEGGMNQRQGGEDFYFIQKLVAVGGYRNLQTTTVYPAVRQSDRVPFGTGPALRRAVSTGEPIATYSPRIFKDLADFCRTATEQPGEMPVAVSIALDKYLKEQNFIAALTEIRRNVSSTDAFRKRLFCWFNAFRFLKFAQFASRNYYPRVPVLEAARDMACGPVSKAPAGCDSAIQLLDWYRYQQR